MYCILSTILHNAAPAKHKTATFCLNNTAAAQRRENTDRNMKKVPFLKSSLIK
jgi:hypothetical protein